MRILIANDAPLVPELGAAQSAFGLADGLRHHRHEVLLWSPQPARKSSRFERQLTSKRRQLEEFAASAGRLDLIDAPAALITEPLGSLARTVARSIQPELRYRWVEVLQSLRTRPISPSTFFSLLASIRTWSAHLRGWERASGILCLGGLETAWMTRRYPNWTHRIGTYRAAPPDSDRATFRRMRKDRSLEQLSSEPRYLWIGRWANHKGTNLLEEWLSNSAANGIPPRVTIAGCGRDVRLDLPIALRANRRIEVVPEFKRDDLPALLREHDAGLFTSVVEGWGLSLQEMLESGLPVYATRAGAVPDLEPWLAPLLRPFPPAASLPAEAHAQVDWPAYESRFNWPQIAREYEDFVTGRLPGVPAR